MINKKFVFSVLLIALMFILVKEPTILFAEENIYKEAKEISNNISENENLISEYEENIKKAKINYDIVESKLSSFSEKVTKLEKDRYYIKERIHFLENKEMIFIDRFIATITNSYEKVEEEDFNFLLQGDFKSFEEVLNRKLRDEDKDFIIDKLKEQEILVEGTIEYESKQIKFNEDKKKELEDLIKENEDKISEVSQKIKELGFAKKEVDQKIIEDKKKSTTFIMPTRGRITSPFGYRIHPTLRVSRLHTGVDIANSTGTKIKASRNGKVIFTGRKGSYGNTIIIDHGNGVKTLYAHLSSIKVSNGSYVTQGNVIGGMGNTGRSTGSHLHFEIQKNGTPVNPLGEI